MVTESVRLVRGELFDDEHTAFRESCTTFLARTVEPDYPQWRADGRIPRKIFEIAAGDGFLGMAIPEAHGGAGIDDRRFAVVVAEQAMLAGAPALALALSAANDVVIPALLRDGTAVQQDALLSRLASAAICGTVVLGDVTIADGEADTVVLDGSARCVVQGVASELLLIIGRDEHTGAPRAALANSGKAGFAIATSDPGIGLEGAGLGDIAFASAPGQPLGAGPAPAEQVLVDLHLSLAVSAVAGARAALVLTTEYVQERKAFGQPIASFENTRQMLGAAAAHLAAGVAFVDAGIRERLSGALSPERAAALKLHCSELYGAVVDTGVQLHGGYGYMMEYPIAHAYADARFWRLYGGTSETLRDVVAGALL